MTAPDVSNRGHSNPFHYERETRKYQFPDGAVVTESVTRVRFPGSALVTLLMASLTSLPGFPFPQ